MSDIFKPLTDEEREINDAIDSHIAAKSDKDQVFKAHLILFFGGWVLFLLSPKGSGFERLGLALFLTGLILLPLHVVLAYRERRKAIKVHKLILPYRRKNALPFYNELVEMFADKKGVHLHLNENGSITVTDKRKKEERDGI